MGYSVANSLQSSLFVMNDYDFEKPKSLLKVQQKSSKQDAAFEWFEYPGRYSVTDNGQTLCQAEDGISGRSKRIGEFERQRTWHSIRLFVHTFESSAGLCEQEVLSDFGEPDDSSLRSGLQRLSLQFKRHLPGLHHSLSLPGEYASSMDARAPCGHGVWKSWRGNLDGFLWQNQSPVSVGPRW